MLNVYGWYYLSNFLHRNKVPLLPKIISHLIRFIFAAWIPWSAKIGKGTILGYGGLGIVIHNRAVIGKYCHIDQNVTIGGTSKKKEVPVIGDFVYIGAGAKVLGPVKVGNNAVIGANAVVVKDVPEGCLVAGIPAHILKSGISKRDYV